MRRAGVGATPDRAVRRRHRGQPRTLRRNHRAATMEHISTKNLIVVAITMAVAAGIPGLLPRLPLPGVVLEIVLGAIIGPQVLGLAHPEVALNFLANLEADEPVVGRRRHRMAPAERAGACPKRIVLRWLRQPKAHADIAAMTSAQTVRASAPHHLILMSFRVCGVVET